MTYDKESYGMVRNEWSKEDTEILLNFRDFFFFKRITTTTLDGVEIRKRGFQRPGPMYLLQLTW